MWKLRRAWSARKCVHDKDLIALVGDEDGWAGAQPHDSVIDGLRALFWRCSCGFACAVLQFYQCSACAMRIRLQSRAYNRAGVHMVKLSLLPHFASCQACAVALTNDQAGNRRSWPFAALQGVAGPHARMSAVDRLHACLHEVRASACNQHSPQASFAHAGGGA